MRRALALGALSWAVGLGLATAPAPASGPGVRLLTESDQMEISGARIDAAADVRGRTYTLRSRPGSAGQKLTLTGLSIRGLLTLAGFDPDRVRFISLVREDGSLATLKRADFAVGSRFPEGPALVTDEGSRTRFFRPVRGADNTNARDNVLVSHATGPLDMTVGGGTLLAVRARARPRRTEVGRTVRFRAHVRFPPAGAAFTYEWDFDDGTSGFGADVTHAYNEKGDFHARVTVQGRGGAGAVCRESCGGYAAVNVRVGKGRTSLRAGIQPGSASAKANGSGTSASGAGSASSGSARAGKGGSNRDGEAGVRAPRGEPAARAAAGTMVTGILLANSPTAQRSSLPALRGADGQTAASRAARKGTEGGGRLGGSVALTLALIALGALHERRRGTLRLA